MNVERAVFIADSHIDSLSEGHRLIEFMKAKSSAVDAYFLLGDMFRLLIGYKKLQTEIQESFLNRIEEIKEENTEIHYLEGNRDFFISGNYLEQHFSSVSEEMSFEVGGVRYLTVHGNLINPEENIYKLWNKISKSGVSRALTKLLPADFTAGMSDYLERKMSTPSGTTYSELPEQAVREYGLDIREKGYGGLILGHFHKKRILDENGIGIYCLPAWFRNHVYLELKAGESPEFKSYNREK